MLLSYAVGLSGAQLLFKLASQRLPAEGSVFHRTAALLIEPYFILAIVCYVALTFAWVWILRTVSLSGAYPFVGLSVALTMTAGVVIFGESFSPRLAIGGMLVVAGIVVLSS